MKRQSWSDISGDTISEDAIRNLYVSRREYRIYPNRYEVGLNVPVILTLRCVLYVLNGTCKYVRISNDETNAIEEILLNAGEVGSIPPGKYSFQTFGNVPIQIVRVYKLPLRSDP